MAKRGRHGVSGGTTLLVGATAIGIIYSLVSRPSAGELIAASMKVYSESFKAAMGDPRQSFIRSISHLDSFDREFLLREWDRCQPERHETTSLDPCSYPVGTPEDFGYYRNSRR